MSSAHPLGWPNALPPARSPCRIDPGKGRRQHRCSAQHADRVESFRLWQEAEWQAAEDATIGYATELEDYWRDRPRPTWSRFLREMRETPRD